MSELTQELIDLQAVCERLGVDDDGALCRAADHITKLEADATNLISAHDEMSAQVQKHIEELEAQLADIKLRMEVALGSTNKNNEWTMLLRVWIQALENDDG